MTRKEALARFGELRRLFAEIPMPNTRLLTMKTRMSRELRLLEELMQECYDKR